MPDSAFRGLKLRPCRLTYPALPSYYVAVWSWSGSNDNVHNNNAEQMLNELVKHNKTFQLMSYPSRTHSISEGEGTSRHLARTYTKFLKNNRPPAGGNTPTS